MWGSISNSGPSVPSVPSFQLSSSLRLLQGIAQRRQDAVTDLRLELMPTMQRSRNAKLRLCTERCRA